MFAAMATSISEAFRRFKSNLEITDLQWSTVSTRQQNVREVLDAGLDVLDSFLTGSYSRNTLIAPLKDADIDIAVVLDVRYYHHYNGQNGGQAGLLDYVKRILMRTYTRTPDISRNGQAVTIRFDDFTVDVVPAFYRQGGGFLIANAITQSWISTDPKKHVEILSNANNAHGGDLVPLIKMIKCWNRENGKFFRSFHLEVLALEIFNNVTISNFSSGLRYFFDKGRTHVAGKNLDPAGYGGDVGSYIDTQEKVRQAVAKFQTAYDKAIKAEEWESHHYTTTAIQTWGQLLGSAFPAHG